MKIITKQKGYIFFVMALLTSIVSALIVAIAYLTITGIHSQTKHLETSRAFRVAEAGLERAAQSVIAGSVACADVNGHTNFTNHSFQDGQFTVTSTVYHPDTLAVLTNVINATATVIPVNTLFEYAPLGRVYIDSEAIDFYGTSTDITACGGSAACLLVESRGVGGTTAASHSLGAEVEQNQCDLTSLGGVPNLTDPISERSVSTQIGLSLGFGWILGNPSGGEIILSLNNGNWSYEEEDESVPDSILNDVVLVEDNDVWAVGNRVDGDALFLHWDGSGWTRVEPNASVPYQNLQAVTCVDSNDCWAVGNSGTFARWNGIEWTSSGFSLVDIPNRTIRNVRCTASNNCWAVADAEGGHVSIIYWNGSSWTKWPTSGMPNQDLLGLDCIDANDCWAVGSGRTFVHWDGSTWSLGALAANVPNKTINSISCVANNYCWAVGVESGGYALFINWNGSVWSRVVPDETVSNNILNDIDCEDENYCWAVGQNSTAAMWNGSAWTGVDLGIANVHLNAVVTEGNDTFQPEVIFWLENFN